MKVLKVRTPAWPVRKNLIKDGKIYESKVQKDGIFFELPDLYADHLLEMTPETFEEIKVESIQKNDPLNIEEKRGDSFQEDGLQKVGVKKRVGRPSKKTS